MAIDLFGRDDNTGPLEIGQLVSEMKVVAKTVFVSKSSRDDAPTDKLDNLTKAVEDFSAIKDKSLPDKTQKDKSWIEQLIGFFTDFMKGTKNKANQKSGGFKSEVEYLKKIATSSGSLYKASQSKNTIWVGICKFDNRAMANITTAIRNAFRRSGTSTTNSVANGTASTGSSLNAALNAASSNANNSGGGGGNGSNSGGSSGRGTSGHGGGGGHGGGHGHHHGLGPNTLNGMRILTGMSKALLGTFQILHNRLTEMMEINLSKIWTGLLSDSNNFRENLRAILHQQIGFVSENRSIEQTYSDLTQSARASGLTRQKFDELYLRNLQRGLVLEGRNGKAREIAAKRMLSVTTTASNTAQMLNLSADETNGLFMDWHQHLAMSAGDIAEMGRHMQTVARNTGVTGKELEKAMASAAKVQKSLEKAGLASVQALKNINTAMAIAQKHGGTDKTSELLDAMSSSSNFFNADPNTRALLSRAAQSQGLTEQLQAGTITQSPELTRRMFQGVQDDMRGLLTNAAGGAFASMGVDTNTMDLTKLTEHMQDLAQVANRGAMAGASEADKQRSTEASIALRAIDNLAKQRGMTVGELQQQARVSAEMSMSVGDRLKSQEDRMKEMQNKGLQNLEEYKQLQRQVMEAQVNSAMTGFNQVSNALASAGVHTFAELQAQAAAGNQKAAGALADLTGHLKEEMGVEGANKFLSNLGEGASKMMDSFDKRAGKAGLNLNDLLKEKGYNNTAEIQKALTSGDAEARERANKSLTEIQQLIATKERTGEDPITNIRETLRDINIYLRKIVDGYLFKISNSLAGVLYWGGQIVAILGSILAIIGTIRLGRAAYNAVGGIGGIRQAVTTGASLARGALGGTAVAAASNTAAAAATTGSAGAAAAGATGAGFLATARGVLASIGTMIPRLLGGILAPLGAAIGGIKGYFEADQAGRSKLEGALFGVLTGGAHTGSMFSSSLGIEKDSAADLALGVLGSAGWGAAIGLALAPFTAGMSIPIGAAIGAAVELFKILTSGVNVIKGMYDFAVGIADYIAGFFASLKGGLEWLAGNEYVGGLFQPISNFYNQVYDTFKEIYNLTGPFFQAIGNWFSTLDVETGLVADFIEVMKVGGMVLSYLGTTFGQSVKNFFTILGAGVGILTGTISTIVNGIQTLSKIIYDPINALTYVQTFCKKIWDDISGGFYWLWDKLVGHSIVPDLIDGIIYWFSMLPINIMKSLAGLGVKIIGWIGEFLMQLPSMIVDALVNLPAMIMNSLSQLPTLLFNGMLKAMQDAWTSFKEWTDNKKIANSIEKADKGMISKTAEVNKSVIEKAKQLNDPQEKVKELERLLQNQTTREIGATQNLELSKKEQAQDNLSIVPDFLVPNWTGLNQGSDAQAAAIKGHEATLQQIQAQKALLIKELEAAKQQANNPQSAAIEQMAKDSATTAKTMEMGQQKGSIFVHDTHCEALLIMLLKAMGAWTLESPAEAASLQKSLEQKAIAERTADTNMSLEGAFQKGEAKDAIAQEMNYKLNMSSLADPLKTSVNEKLIEKTKTNPALLGAFSKDVTNNAMSNAQETNNNNNSLVERIIGSGMTGIMSPVSMILGKITSELLSSALNTISRNISSVSGKNLGLFESDQVKDASLYSTNINNTDKALFSANEGKSSKSSISQKDSGLFNKTSNVDEAMLLSTTSTENLNNVVSSALENKKSTQKQMILAELSKALDYERSGSEAAEKQTGLVSSNLLDYREDMKGQVDTLGLSRSSIEGSLQQQRAGEATSGSVLMPSMDAISNYLTDIQYGKLVEIRDLLQDIKDGMRSGVSSSTVIGAVSGAIGPTSRPGVKSISQDKARGFWDLTFGDASPGAVTTEGRGGTS